MRFLLARLLVSFVAVPQAYADRLTGVARVIDGDTLEIQGQRRRFGQQAAFALADTFGRRQVSWPVACQRYGQDHVFDETDARFARCNIWSGRFEIPSDRHRAQRGG